MKFKYLFIGVIIIILFHFPMLYWYKESFIIINDNLDCDFLYIHLLKISNNLFNLNPNSILDLMGEGVKLSYFHSPINITKAIFFLFDSLNAYFVNSFLIRFIGFFGMIKLTKDYYSLGNFNSFLIAISFSLIPIGNSIYGLSVLGLPLLLWAYKNIDRESKIALSCLIYFLYPLYSLIQFSSPFIIIAYCFFLINNAFLRKKIKYHLVNLLLFIFSVLLFNYNIIETLFYEGDMKSARILRGVTELPSFFGAIYIFFKQFLFGDNISALFLSFPILIILIFKWSKLSKLVKFILAILILNTLVFTSYPFLFYHFPSVFGPFNFGRIIFLNSFLFYLLLIETKYLYTLFQYRSVLILIIALNLFRNQEFLYNISKNFIEPDSLHWVYEDDKNLKSIFPSKIVNNNPDYFHQKGFFTFEEFYSVNLFSKIKKKINKDLNSFKSITIGINPGIIQYNGFQSLSSYLVNYPIALHKKFERINYGPIKPNGLYINTKLECGNYCNKFNSGNGSINIDINIEELRTSNISYIFSAVRINNANLIGISLVDLFSDENSPYNIYLYKI